MYKLKKYVLLLSSSLIGIAWFSQLAALFSGKTELDLNGIEVIKESAEILAHSIETFPSAATAIALIGLIMASQGIYFLATGLISILSNIRSNKSDASLHRLGYAQLFIGLLFTSCGCIATLYCALLAEWLFG